MESPLQTRRLVMRLAEVTLLAVEAAQIGLDRKHGSLHEGSKRSGTFKNHHTPKRIAHRIEIRVMRVLPVNGRGTRQSMRFNHRTMGRILGFVHNTAGKRYQLILF